MSEPFVTNESSLIGSIASYTNLYGHVTANGPISGSIKNDNALLSGTISSINNVFGSIKSNAELIGVISVPKELPSEEKHKFDGPYELVPKVESQIVCTKDKWMDQNVTVLSIPYFKVDNLSGGQTVTIGG